MTYTDNLLSRANIHGRRTFNTLQVPTTESSLEAAGASSKQPNGGYISVIENLAIYGTIWKGTGFFFRMLKHIVHGVNGLSGMLAFDKLPLPSSISLPSTWQWIMSHPEYCKTCVYANPGSEANVYRCCHRLQLAQCNGLHSLVRKAKLLLQVISTSLTAKTGPLFVSV